MSVSDDRTLSDRLVRSALSGEYAVGSLGGLTQWRMDPDSGGIGHVSGKFFSVQGLDVRIPGAVVPHWNQPIISQPEVGILGILMREINGVLHCLMQLKAEPGNCNGIQISPTVQATRSNYMRVHGGHPTPYLDYFRDRWRHRVVVDVRQSEQGSWFLRKRNRNMVIEVTEPVEALDGFVWLTVAQLNELLAVDDLVNMDARSVLSCLPFLGPVPQELTRAGDGFARSLTRSWSGRHPSAHTTGEVLSWVSERRAAAEVAVERIPLQAMAGWRYDGEWISYASSRFFDVIGVRVEAGGREVGRWDQPMIAARGTGLVAFLVTHLRGVLHVLVNTRVEPGFVDVAELAPTVQCIPDNYRQLPRSGWPPFLEEVLGADPGRVRFDVVQSEEGGRFYHTRTRHLIVETDQPLSHPDFRWMTPHQLTTLLAHSHYVNVQARSLLACLRTLAAAPARHQLLGGQPTPPAAAAAPERAA